MCGDFVLRAFVSLTSCVSELKRRAPVSLTSCVSELKRRAFVSLDRVRVWRFCPSCACEFGPPNRRRGDGHSEK